MPPQPSDLTSAQRARRDRIVDAAFDLLLVREYDAISIKEVADHSGVALGTLYRYFASKEHLFAAALVKWGSALRTTALRKPGTGNDISSDLLEIYLRAVRAFERRPQFFGALIALESSCDPHARLLWIEFSTTTSESFNSPLRQFVPERAEAISNTLMYVLHGSLRSWANGSLSIDGVRQRLTQAIGLVFSPPPVP